MKISDKIFSGEVGYVEGSREMYRRAANVFWVVFAMFGLGMVGGLGVVFFAKSFYE